jgi:hypothetical protein
MAGFIALWPRLYEGELPIPRHAEECYDSSRLVGLESTGTPRSIASLEQSTPMACVRAAVGPIENDFSTLFVPHIQRNA